MDRVRRQNEWLFSKLQEDVNTQLFTSESYGKVGPYVSRNPYGFGRKPSNDQLVKRNNRPRIDLGPFCHRIPKFHPNPLVSIGRPLLKPLRYKVLLANRQKTEQSSTTTTALLGADGSSSDITVTTSSSTSGQYPPIPNRPVVNSPSDLPTSFDWRILKDSQGKTLLTPARDQGECGSCYAFSTADSLSQRFIIGSGGTMRPILSPQDMVNCGRAFVAFTFNNPEYNATLTQLYNNGTLEARADWYALEGCQGGLLVSALDYCVIYGLPLDSEVPYTGKESSPSYCITRSDKLKTLHYGEKTHSLTEGWEDGLPENDVKLPQRVLQSNIENMQMAIIVDGPIVSAINIFSDLLYYPHNGPIYQRESTILINGKEQKVQYEGGHAVVIVGWGEQKDQETGETTPYWICQNSWGDSWGFDGYFMILRGVNMCNIEYEAYGVFPHLSGGPVVSEPPLGSIPPAPSSASSSDLWWLSLVIIGGLIVVSIVISVSLWAAGRNKMKKAINAQNSESRLYPTANQ